MGSYKLTDPTFAILFYDFDFLFQKFDVNIKCYLGFFFPPAEVFIGKTLFQILLKAVRILYEPIEVVSLIYILIY